MDGGYKDSGMTERHVWEYEKGFCIQVGRSPLLTRDCVSKTNPSESGNIHNCVHVACAHDAYLSNGVDGKSESTTDPSVKVLVLTFH